jgi:phospholipase D3/4
MGGDSGRDLFHALENAAIRGIKIRILQCSQVEENEKKELAELAKYKDQVEFRQVDMNDWYAGGIMHQKIWVFDNKDIYLGSANMDWRSLTQVKELGIVLENQPEFAKDVTRYFEGWWHIASTAAPTIEKVYDPACGFIRTVPAWSPLVPEEKRMPSPLEAEEFGTRYNMEYPMSMVLNGQQAEAFITGCPIEFCAPCRTYDGDAIVHTILKAKKSICINVMDFAPVSLYSTPTVWWPMLFNALMSAVITNGVHVRLLVSKWEHTPPITEPFLRALKETATVGEVNYINTCGSLEIRLFNVPGWHSTVGQDRLYPGHSRVNHAKYIVTDQRLNIGTSNFTWDYFVNNAGTSFNSNHTGLVKKLQEIFDRDWESQYAYPI